MPPPISRQNGKQRAAAVTILTVSIVLQLVIYYYSLVLLASSSQDIISQVCGDPLVRSKAEALTFRLYQIPAPFLLIIILSSVIALISVSRPPRGVSVIIGATVAAFVISLGIWIDWQARQGPFSGIVPDLIESVQCIPISQ